MAREQRRLAAIVAADVAGYSRLMGRDESGTLAALKAVRRDIVDPQIAAHGGRVVKTTGDGLLLEFRSVVDAVQCVIEVQTVMATRGADLPEDRRIAFRIGINLGDIIVDGDDIFGDGVNIAARLQELAAPGGMCMSGRVHDDVRDRLDLGFEDGGMQSLRNIARPVHVWRWSSGVAAPASAALVLPDKPSIAVLPFQNMSGDSEQEFFGDGICEDITTALSRIRGFFVIARNSSFTYKGKSLDIRQVGRDLGVRYVLQGSVRKASNRLRITAQLNDAITGHHLWAERYEREVTDLFAVQDEITESVVASIEPQLLLAEGASTQRKRPSDLGAWECVTRALSLLSRFTAADHSAALALLARAIERDPQYARALAIFAFINAVTAYQGWRGERSVAFTEAAEAARKATALDPDDPWAHHASGMVALIMRRYDEAVASLSKAVELNPNFAFAHSTLGRALIELGRLDDALHHTSRALRTSPRDPNKHLFLHWHAIALLAGCRYCEAAEWAQRAIRERPPGLAGSHRTLVAAHALDGKIEQARAALRDLKQVQPEVTLAWVDENADTADAQRSRLLEGLRLAGLAD